MCNVSESVKKVTSFTEKVRHHNFFPNWAHPICNLQTGKFLNKIMIAMHIFGASLVAQLVKNLPAVQETPIQFLVWEDPLEKDRLPTPVFLGFPGGSAGKKSAYNAGNLGWEDPLEKRMATHPSILTWRIPRTV